MPVPASQQRILFQRSGNQCAFPECERVLTAASSPVDEVVVLGEVAHIVAESSDGPRGGSALTLEDRNRYVNLVLLCNNHHQIVDSQPETYTVEWLKARKEEHEARVEESVGRYGASRRAPAPPLVRETIHSNLLPVERMPPAVYGVPCDLRNERDVADQLHPMRSREMAPFILRGGMLWAFQNLADPSDPFRDLARGHSPERHISTEWWGDRDRLRWYIDLLNRATNKLTGRKGLKLDRRHRRYYFEPKERGRPLEVEYRPLNRRWQRRSVVWQPTSRRTGEGRGYWLHRAVGLRYNLLDGERWCLSIRPELRATKDGFAELPPEEVGPKVTRETARRFNYDLLGEVNFWRDFLGGSGPRIILPFGPPTTTKQRVVMSTTLMHGEVSWPGIPEEHAKPYKNVDYLDDLFSWAEFNQPNSGRDDTDDWDRIEEDEKDGY